MGVREITVTRGDGGEKAPALQPVQPVNARMRPKDAVRHELVGFEIVQVDHGVVADIDDDLMITILDDNDNFLPKKTQRKKL